MSTETLANRGAYTEVAETFPEIINGGMGVAISGWELAGEVSARGGMGIISGTAIGVVLARRLQNGDMDNNMRQALDEFPDQEMVGRIMKKYYIEEGRDPDKPFVVTPMMGAKPQSMAIELNILGAFTEVRRAQLHARDITGDYGPTPGPIGMNLLTKVEPPTPSALYGAMLANADSVIMGAGIPYDIPAALDSLAEGKPAKFPFTVTDGSAEQSQLMFDPNDYGGVGDAPLKRPVFLAIISSNILAKALSKNDQAPPDGFVIEGPTAGGHNAPPRGKLMLDELGQPIYGPKDIVKIDKIVELGLPFWLAGGRITNDDGETSVIQAGTPEGLRNAKEVGAKGIQVGSAFALSQNSGWMPEVRDNFVRSALNGGVEVLTNNRASSTGFPIKLAQLEGTMTDDTVYEDRTRICDQGYLREAFKQDSGIIGYRCSAEPEDKFLKKGGTLEDTLGRMCLCNGLLAAAGLGQVRVSRKGEITREQPVFTVGGNVNDAIRRIVAFSRSGQESTATDVPAFTAADVMSWLRRGSDSITNNPS